LPVAIPEEVIVATAAAAEDHGYSSFWLNNPPNTHALPPLGRAAHHTGTIWLGVGIIPLSHHPPGEIVREVVQNNLPLNRFYLGIGSGPGSSSVERVAEGVRAIRSQLQSRLVVAALGPRMCRLAGAAADGVLLNWLTPQFARASIDWVREGAQEADRPVPRLMAYVRVALGEEATTRLQREAASYEAIPQYAAHFRRMGVSAMGTTVTGATPEDIRRGLTGWDGVVDEVVVRAVTAQDTVEDLRQLLEAAKPAH
jgi:alkanesulfonate monooxygenase SsuD/methylene tetrahydromethanopterin reductase-like flavin-dependent oxidoreductase (luciferase family)